MKDIKILSIKIHDEINRLREEKGIDIFKMPKQEFSKWVEYLVSKEENNK